MEFRNPETGEVFPVESYRFCGKFDGCCKKCPLFSNISKVIGGDSNANKCNTWVTDNPYEAARLMGYEVVEDDTLTDTSTNGLTANRNILTGEEANMDKPRICEVLGVDVGERFRVEGQDEELFVNEQGWVFYGENGILSSSGIQTAINHPDRIIRKPRFTEQEVERGKAIKVLYPEADSLDECDPQVKVLNNKFVIATLDKALFPTLRPGESVKLDEIIGGAE